MIDLKTCRDVGAIVVHVYYTPTAVGDSLFVGINVGDSLVDSVGKNVGTLVGDSLSVG